MKRRDFFKVVGLVGAWPLVAHAQQPAAPVIGFLSSRSPDESKHVLAAFHKGLNEGGFVEGTNVVVEYRWALGEYEKLPALAADLVKRNVSVIAAVGGDVSARAAEQATSVIPIVFGAGSDVVKAGLVKSLSKPEANATGFTLLTNDLEPKRLGLLHDLLPKADVVGVLFDPNFRPAVDQLAAIEKAAKTIALRVDVLRAGNDNDLNTGLHSLRNHRVSALLVTAAPYFDTRRARIIEFAAENKIPAIYQFREYAVDGGLISYGPRITESYRQAGAYVGRILNGAKPRDLPVLQPTNFDFVINLKTAKALGLTIPPGLISFADDVIE
ncbi:MAG TPA: ABC transporter substrate-binding protein [Pseudolabrys sp.]|nr:ABC transporter substrate-binding protein [Pseudolabrys sp.]